MRPALVLASSSPRRRQILAGLGLAFDVRSADVDETLRDGESPFDGAERLAREKAATVAALADGALVVAADTLVVFDGAPLGKPRDRADARRMLGLLAGRAHEVVTGVALALEGRIASGREVTEVVFAPMTPGEIEAYAASGEPDDKAGRTRSRESADSSSSASRAAPRTSSACPCGSSTRSRRSLGWIWG